MSVNTLLSARAMLGLAMHRVVSTMQPDAIPFELTAEFELPPMCATLTADAFMAEVLAPALEAAVWRPLDPRIEFARGDPMVATFAGSEADGIVGRLVQCYDFKADRALARIDIRVLDTELLVTDEASKRSPES